MWPCGRVGVYGGVMNDEIGSKTCVIFFDFELFSTGRPKLKSRVFRLHPPVGILRRK